MQASFKRNLILIGEAFLAFILLQLTHFIIGISSPLLLGIIVVFFSLIFFLTTYLFLKRVEKKSRVVEMKVQAELA